MSGKEPSSRVIDAIVKTDLFDAEISKTDVNRGVSPTRRRFVTDLGCNIPNITHYFSPPGKVEINVI